jgi:hypothetical protein
MYCMSFVPKVFFDKDMAVLTLNSSVDYDTN